MKNVYLSALLCLLIAACGDPSAKDSFKVWGNCEMCKETIEGALKTEGVQSAVWNTESKLLQVEYNPDKINLDEIQKLVAAAGYDNDKYKADDEAYMDLAECCQYKRKP